VSLKVKRVYEPPSDDDGHRVLVDRLWPRALRKEDARIDAWLREVSPSNELRKWYNHDPQRWEEFCARYEKELAEAPPEALASLRRRARRETVTLLFSSRELEFNNAHALKRILERKRAR